MPTDLVALAARKRHERARAANEMSAMLASLGVCLVNPILIFAFPTLANAVAVLGPY